MLPQVIASTFMHGVQKVPITSTIKEGVKYIGTHHGTFHCDEALAVSLLMQLPEFSNHSVLRTRDLEALAKCDIVVDVGGEYHPETRRFDHHQKTFSQTFPQYTTKLSSAGLVYMHYGKRLIQEIASEPLSDSICTLLYNKIYVGFVEHIDGIDNGVDLVSSGEPLNYRISTTLSNRIGYLNPNWNEESSSDIVNERFRMAMMLAGTEFIDYVLNLTESWLPARALVEKAISERFEIHPSGSVVLLNTYCPWKSHLYSIEEQLGIKNDIKFILYEDSTGKMWRIQGINVEEGGFALRLALPESWRGLRDDELSKVSGISDCTFVHAAGFIGGNKTLAGVKDMAAQALNSTHKRKEMSE